MLYTRYSGMLFSYILQFVPDEKEAATLLVDIFSRLTPKLQNGFDSHLSVYCWLQVESRKIILEHLHETTKEGGQTRTYYFSLLEDAPPEHQWVFRELFLNGRKKEELAACSGKDLAYISKILRECLVMIRKNLG
ncbi:hypothetical protein GCM10011511_13360 [Puia dinghuensis]|uniref:Uncharacterized protein n=2 Tax=Puia dinghuensis TaxID=1792502 RepID=A0A8J2UBG2_9BACT|nr:hypothetical protein GCM10011511_13360 [Puia dinghuensis]